NAAKNNGFRAIKVSQTGEYAIHLRRWPIEADAPITASLPAGGPIPGGDPYPKGKALSITKARLKIANIDMTKTVQPDDKAITFRVNLKAGSTRMQTWLTDKKDKTRGAYYVYVKKIKK
ncbi:MAG: N-acetylgalactosamine-4-sulfatase, partial [Planctomycetota bacterium]